MVFKVMNGLRMPLGTNTLSKKVHSMSTKHSSILKCLHLKLEQLNEKLATSNSLRSSALGSDLPRTLQPTPRTQKH